jgi:hypothetical protein
MHHLRASALAATLLSLAVTASPASADVKSGRLIESFHGINYVGVDGFPANEDVLVEVVRGTTVIGHATKRTDRDGFFEINHVGGDDCFDTQTPDILPGDVVRTTVVDDPEDTDSMLVRDVVNDAPVVDPATGDITVSGHARVPGTTTPLDAIEVRLNHPGGTWDANGADGRKDWRVQADIAADGSFVATFSGGSADDLQAVQSAEVASEWINAAGTEITVFDGLSDGACGPAATTAVTSVSPAVVNAASDGMVTVSGAYADGIEGVLVGDVDATLAGGTWTARVDVSDEPEGIVTLPVTFSGPTAPPQQTATVRKDTVAPAAPTSDLAPGVYPAAQSVHLGAGGEEIRYTTDGTPATATSARYAGAIVVTASRTVRAVAIDAAGNVGPEATFAYTIQPPEPQVVVQEIVRTVPAVDQAPPVTTPRPATKPAAPKPTLRITGLSYGRTVKLATVASKGMRIKMVLPAGTRSLDVSIRRDGKLIARRTKTSRAGAYAHALKLTRKGAYTVVLRPLGTSAGTPATVAFRVV